MKVAIEGCCHGELDTLYATLLETQERLGKTIDLLLICGDFQAIRSSGDLESLACPPKYRSLGHFWEYYAGIKTAPIPTLFIGGNHESSHFLWELFHGGFTAQNIYFLGFGGVVNFGGLRIGGLSGIYKSYHYSKGFYEKQPFNEADSRSIYHIREYNVRRILQIQDAMDVFLSHDWPRGIAQYGDLNKLLRAKPFLKNEIDDGSFGSLPGEWILKKLKSKYWFAAHLHVKFAALYPHGLKSDQKIGNPDEIVIDDSDDDDEDSAKEQPTSDAIINDFQTPVYTRFLALDKILPGRPFLQILDIPSLSHTDDSIPKEFTYDEEWLAIAKATAEYLSLDCDPISMPSDLELDIKVQECRKWVKENVSCYPDKMKVPPFVMTAPIDTPSLEMPHPFTSYINPQTSHFCNLLEIPNLINQNGQIVEYPVEAVGQEFTRVI